MSVDNGSNTTSQQHNKANPLKRKRKEEESDTVQADTFVLRAAGSTTKITKTFTPLYLLPRAQLPLAWLDTTDGGIQLFNGSIHMLEREKDEAASIVVAVDSQAGRRWVIERAGHKTYALCRLVVAIEARVLEKRSSVKYHERKKEDMHATAVSNKRCHILTPPPHASSPPVEAKEPHKQLIEKTIDLQPENSINSSSQELLQELSKQYLEALYTSRTAVAYFTKGPLSRVRNAFSGQSTTELHITNLTHFLREMLLSSTTTEKRWREHIPTVIRELMKATDDSTTKVKRTKWKPRRDRQGFLNDEKHYLEQWWQKTDEAGADLVQPLNITQRTQFIRNREAFLQVILTMELMALESTFDTQSESVSAPEKKSSRRPIDLQSHLEYLLDKLTIWHSVDFKSPQKSEGKSEEANDELKGFCMEVVIPFYQSRISKVARFVNKKLGGPTAPPPLKRTVSGKPGEPAIRHAPSKEVRTLQRTATDPLRHKGRTPTLQRSATDSQLPDGTRLKRESSASLSLHSIPAARMHHRQSSSALASLTRREIDLTAVSAATDARLRKKADQEAKIREAVASIRRPDRALALKETAASVDAKFAKSLPASKRAVCTQIVATPSASRFIATTPRKDNARDTVPTTTHHSSSLFAVPQTGHRQRVVDQDLATPSKPQHDQHVLAETPLTRLVNLTPSRPRSLLFTPVNKSIIPLTEACQNSITTTVRSTLFPPTKHTTEAATPANSNSRSLGVPITGSCQNTIATRPTIEKSVYDAFGWNDDYEELA